MPKPKNARDILIPLFCILRGYLERILIYKVFIPRSIFHRLERKYEPYKIQLSIQLTYIFTDFKPARKV